jgi:glycosyltransferase involved in cell wall biosynthesis
MPSRSEGFGLSLTEAVSKKVPVLCSDLPVFRELFSNDEISFFHSNDVKSLTDSVLNVSYADSNKPESAYARYRKSYTADRMVEQYVLTYEELLSSTPSSPSLP